VAALGDFFALSFVAVSPDTAAPGSGRPDSAQPDSAQRDSRQLDSRQPDSAQPDSRQAARWQPADVAYQRGMRDLAAQMGRMLGTREHRVAVSTLQLGYAARLWSPVLACALAHGIVPDLAGLEVGTRLPLRVRLPAAAGWNSPDFDGTAGLLYDVVVTGHLAPLAAGLRGRVASGLLRGNAASALIGSLTVLAGARPGLAGPARSIADRLLATGMLRGTGQLTGTGQAFRRNSCCLYYRVPGGGLCGDCSLDDSKP
jgi:FhuF 2Fe-2S C-terminal domain